MWVAPLDVCELKLPDTCGTPGASINVSTILPSLNWENFVNIQFGADTLQISSVAGVTSVRWKSVEYPLISTNDFSFGWGLDTMTVNELVLPWTPMNATKCTLGRTVLPGISVVSVNNINSVSLKSLVPAMGIESCYLNPVAGTSFVYGSWSLTPEVAVLTGDTSDSSVWGTIPNSNNKTATIKVIPCFETTPICNTLVNCTAVDVCVVDFSVTTCTPI